MRESSSSTAPIARADAPPGAAAPVTGVPGPGARAPRYTIAACEPAHPDRPALEDYVRAGFERSHRAHVSSFMPTLLALRDRGARLCGVVGFRGAADARLYVEHYLDVPVERAITTATGRPVARASIVEVGNLAAANCRSARHLAARLPRVLLAARYEWLVFTGTRVVREILAGFGAPLLDLGPADRARLPAGEDAWGGYYDAEPRVTAGFLPHARTLGAFARGLDH